MLDSRKLIVYRLACAYFEHDDSSSNVVILWMGTEKEAAPYWTEQSPTIETIDVKDTVFGDVDTAYLQALLIWTEPSPASSLMSDAPMTIDMDNECIGLEASHLYWISNNKMNDIYHANDGYVPHREGNTTFSDDTGPCYYGNPDVGLQTYEQNSSFVPADTMSTSPVT
ncbi:hypothetical protein FISHEDRAFT_77154 [Fistulina hepatica ATCC 64428]|uniref:Uncharacterized protein n=1 Tax=Fistulina hepatica ATCC 64428 TaxID=1128425 RepID=A0A0D7A4V5_9AGAR|nr:hypothetical protein FISHEDRAFT_77154 [Fistulina hepatica ATCC 64428]